MRLFIAEKPSLGKTVAKVIDSHFKSDGKSVVLSNGDRITWAFGHLIELASPDHYVDIPANANGRKPWRSQDLPILPDRFAYQPKDDEIEKHLNQIKRWSKDATQIVHVGDPDREGQSIIDQILISLNIQLPVMRLWLKDLTDNGIKQALANMKPNSEYKGFFLASQARQKADWLVGMNLTRALTIQNNGLLSAGRVQTPTLQLIINRDLAIENFKPMDFYELYASTDNGITAKFKPDDSMLDADGYMVDKAYLAQVKSEIEQSGKASVSDVEKKSGKRNAPLPFSLSELQKVANSTYGFSAQQVLDIAQSLYETHKVTSYPRSDCQYLNDNQHNDAPAVLAKLANLSVFASDVKGANTDLKSSAFDDKKVTAHTAIIPTGVVVSNLNDAETKVYELIVKRYVAQFYPAQTFDTTQITLSSAGHTLTAKGKVITNAGWTTLFSADDDDKDTVLPNVNVGDVLAVDDVSIKAKKTTPPARFTEGTLIEAMNNVAKFVDDEQAKAVLKETDGIGTEATRANVIETLKKREYVEQKGKQIISTAKGRSFISLCPPMIANPITTAQWEGRMSEIERTGEGLDDFIQEIKETTRTLVTDVLSAQSTNIGGQSREAESLGTCPCCKKGRIVKGKKGFGCSEWKTGCKFVIWQEIAGKKISDAQVKKLLEKGKTDLIKGFTSKAGKPFDAYLKMDSDFKIVFEFEPKKAG